MHFLPAAIMYRDVAWWRLQQGQCLTGMRHHREGRPTFKWERVFTEVIGTEWKDTASDDKKWKQLKGEFVSKAYRLLRVAEVEQRFPERHSRRESGGPCKKRRVACEAPERWNLNLACQFQLLVRGDNLTVIRWLQGQWSAKCSPYASRVRAAIAHVEQLHCSFAIMPQDLHLEIFEHVPRELNGRADELSKSLADKETMQYWLDCTCSLMTCLRIHFDGSFDKNSGEGAAAWHLET
eukprot:5218764-Karenia_brevis.AAC.1